MSSSKHKRYTSEFKAEAVKRARQVGPYQVCDELGVSSSSIYKWLAEAGYPGNTDAPQADKTIENPFKLNEEITRLRKENARLKEEREILKKATVFFAKHAK